MGLVGLDGTVDFVLAFAVVHEFPAAGPFFTEVSQEMIGPFIRNHLLGFGIEAQRPPSGVTSWKPNRTPPIFL
jgi:hypothetical protein